MSFFGSLLPAALRQSANVPAGSDLALFVAVNQEWRNGLLDYLVPILSYSFPFWLCVGLLVVRHVYRKIGGNRRKAVLLACLLACAVGTADASTSLVKGIVLRPRPNNTLPDVYHYKEGAWRRTAPDFAGKPWGSGNSAFYSAHAANSATVVAFLTGAAPGLSPLLYAVPLCVGYSRVYAGKHYPGDILCGWLAGLLIGRLYASIYRRIVRRKEAFFAQPTLLRQP